MSKMLSFKDYYFQITQKKSDQLVRLSTIFLWWKHNMQIDCSWQILGVTIIKSSEITSPTGSSKLIKLEYIWL